MEHYRAHLLWIGHKDCASGVTLSPIKLTSINFEYNRIVSAEIKAIYIVISFEVSTHKRLLPNGWQLRTQTSDEQPTRLAKMQSVHRSNTPLALDTWTISTISTLYLEYLGKKTEQKGSKMWYSPFALAYIDETDFRRIDYFPRHHLPQTPIGGTGTIIFLSQSHWSIHWLSQLDCSSSPSRWKGLCHYF